MKLQRRDSHRVEQPLYDGAGVLGLEAYFADSTRLTTSVLRYHFEPGASEGMHRHDATATDSCTPDDSDELYLVIQNEPRRVLTRDRTPQRYLPAVVSAPHPWAGPGVVQTIVRRECRVGVVDSRECP
jgi:hypothetical protein